MFDVFACDPANYFLLQSTQSLAIFLDSLEKFSHDLQVQAELPISLSNFFNAGESRKSS